MPQIQILDVATANRIAAGEVVERPASVAKELIENALDAGAGAVTVEIREGGIEYLRVTDNGAGFPAPEVRVAFERHATSKLRSGDLLDGIATLGFRGEALPSIAAVSRVELTTRQAGQESGVRLKIEGGDVKDLREAGCPEGTTMVVRDLFFNTPARREFLKRAATEGGYVGDAVLQLALARCDVAFRYVVNGKTMFHTPGDGDLRKTIQMLFGAEISSGFVPVKGSFAGGMVDGFLGLQDAARANRQREFFIINGRFIRSPLLALAVEEAVKGHIAIGKYPFCVLRLEVPLGSVDVNVHPNKLEVRFRDETRIRSSLQQLIADSLAPTSAQPRVPLLPPAPEKKQMPEVTREPAYRAFPGAASPVSVAAEPGMMSAPFPMTPPLVSREEPKLAAPEPEVKTSEFSVSKIELPIQRNDRLLGVLFSTYLLVESGDDFYLIDQHAAHERLLYEQLRVSMEQKAAAQMLLSPYEFDVTPREKERLLENIEHFEAIGFHIYEFGPLSLRVDAVPHILGDPQLREFFIELMDNIDSIGSMRTAELKRDAIARIACGKAVKAGDRLTERETTELLSMVMQEETPLTCPHGRPILLKMTRAQIEKRFRRVQ